MEKKKSSNIKDKKQNAKIKCDVETCDHNDNKDLECKLEEIKISCNHGQDEVSGKESTECESYDEKEEE